MLCEESPPARTRRIAPVAIPASPTPPTTKAAARDADEPEDVALGADAISEAAFDGGGAIPGVACALGGTFAASASSLRAGAASSSGGTTTLRFSLATVTIARQGRFPGAL